MRINRELLVPFQRILQAGEQMLGSNAPAILGSLFVSMPNRATDVELGMIKIQIRPFQCESFTDPYSC
jgi:hypothetical protein